MEKLRAADWIHIPMLLSDGLKATLLFEKGTAGRQMIEAALKAPVPITPFNQGSVPR